ncbi:hypothetical protein ACQ4PT_059361 [Festuca glaucescens]
MDDEEVSRSSFAQSKFNPAKRFRLLSSNTQTESMLIGRDNSKELKQVVLVLKQIVADMKEFAILLMSYPRMYRQPYDAYLYLDKYMFGRQRERDQAISLLLHAEPLGGGNLGVLPIVGPGHVGKSTLVYHVCDDEWVCSYFSMIFHYRGNCLPTKSKSPCSVLVQGARFSDRLGSTGRTTLCCSVNILRIICLGTTGALLKHRELPRVISYFCYMISAKTGL